MVPQLPTLDSADNAITPQVGSRISPGVFGGSACSSSNSDASTYIPSSNSGSSNSACSAGNSSSSRSSSNGCNRGNNSSLSRRGNCFRMNTSGIAGCLGPLYSTALAPLIKDGAIEVSENRQDDTCDVYLISQADELHRRLTKLKPGCRVNHFPGMVDVCEKVGFARVLRQMMPLCPGLGAYIPPMWILPEDMPAVLDMLDTPGPTKTFIVKPEYGLQGDGIFIVQKRTDLQVGLGSRRQTSCAGIQGSSCACQQYIERPLLVGGHKFDFRIYLVLVSLSPLEAHICREGLARFCTTPYATPSAANIHTRTAHLTNYNLNKHCQDFAHSDSAAPTADASKRLLSTTLQQLSETIGLDEALFWERVTEISGLVLTALAPVLSATSKKYVPGTPGIGSCCYHVLGIDVLLDESHWPWLLEVNSSPSMDIEAALPLSEAERKSLPSMQDVVRDQCLPCPLPAQASPAKQKPRKPAKSPARASCSQGAAPDSLPVAAPPRDLTGASSQPLTAARSPKQAKATSKKPIKKEGSSQRESTLEGAPRKAGKKRTSQSPVAQTARRFTDPWAGYNPTELRKHKPWPEICFCTELREPHRHSRCPVDERVKVLLVTNIVRTLMGQTDRKVFSPVVVAGDCVRALNAMDQCVLLNSRMKGHSASSKTGFGGGELRKLLRQTTEVVAPGGGGRLSMNELDIIASRHRTCVHAAFGRKYAADWSILDMVSVLIQVANKCCERSQDLAGRAPLDKLEWLLAAIGTEPQKGLTPVPVILSVK